MFRPLVILIHSVCLLMLLVFTTSCTAPAVSSSALSLAKKRVAQEVGKPPKKGTLVVVDYSKPSSEKRLTVVDLKSGVSKMNSRVAHGVNSGLLYATNFSNTVGSRKSSLGLYELSEEFRGKHGTSFRLDGLDRSVNDNARRRGIIVHSADYATTDAMRKNRHEYHRLGRSAGCLALSDKDMARLDRKLVRPAYVFAYAPMLAQQPQPQQPKRSTPKATRAPSTMLASAKLPSTSEKPAVVRPPVPEKPAEEKAAIARPLVIETGPVALNRDQLPAPFTTSAVLYRP